jgi:hypothetical protein
MNKKDVKKAAIAQEKLRQENKAVAEHTMKASEQS